MNNTCTAPRHGTLGAHRAGCRCPAAVEARRLYIKRRRTGRQPAGIVDATGTHRRLRALQAIGWSTAELAARLGRPRSHRALSPFLARPRCTATTAAAVAALYDELCMTPGPSHSARIRAARAGWAPPLAWDDASLDNPSTVPDFGAPERPNRKRRLRLDEALHAIVTLGMSEREAARHLKVPRETLRTAIRRDEQRQQTAELEAS